MEFLLFFFFFLSSVFFFYLLLLPLKFFLFFPCFFLLFLLQVLTPGHKLQDDAAEDPLMALRSGLRADYALYWQKKIQKPLSELFATCLTSSQLQSLLNGPHTLLKVDTVAAPPQPPAQPPMATKSSSGGGGRGGAAAGPSSPSPFKGRGGGRGDGRGGGKLSSTSGSGSGGSRQTGLLNFFKATAKCLGCKRAITGFKGNAEDAPGLCDSCAGEDGRWEISFLTVDEEYKEGEARKSAAHAACRQCHSGLVTQDILCDNGECPVTYSRASAEETMRRSEMSLRRLDIF